VEGAREQNRRVGGTSHRAADWLAWSLAAVSLALLLAGMTFSYLSRSTVPDSVDAPTWLEYAFTAMFATYPTVGAVVASRRPTNAVGWLLCVVGLATALERFTDEYSHYADAMGLAGVEAAAFLYGINPGIILAIFVPLVFPDGRLPSRRWRLLVWLIGAGVTIYAVDAALEPAGPDPLGVELPPNVYGGLVVVQIALFLVGIP
jgi:two-component system, NarL family, sensor kinase